MICNAWSWCAVIIASCLVFAASARAAEGGEWTVISDKVTRKLAAEGKQKGDFNLTGGVAVDPKSGDVYLVICDQGLWKSTDHGRTFERIDQGMLGGRCETACSISVDPAGERLACFMVYGSSAATSDGGKSFSKLKTTHFNFGAVDWQATGKTMFAYRHESGHTLTLSKDAGATWTDVGKGFVGRLVGVFDADTLIAGKGDGILRSTDGGAHWTKVASVNPVSPVVQIRGGVGYLLGEQGLLVTKDKGATWKSQGSPVKALLGPYFGRENGHLLVVGRKGVLETNDAGATWKLIAPLPPDFRVNPLGIAGGQPSFAYDPARDILYASWMGKPAYKLER